MNIHLLSSVVNDNITVESRSRGRTLVSLCNFTPDFSKKFPFPVEVRKIGILLYLRQLPCGSILQVKTEYHLYDYGDFI